MMLLLLKINNYLNNNEEESDYYFLNTFYINKNILIKYIDKIQQNNITKEHDLIDIVSLIPDKKGAYILNPFIANKECIIIKKIEDKNFAEELYLEHRNANFIHQCYGLWKQCDKFDSRISFVEKILEKNNIN